MSEWVLIKNSTMEGIGNAIRDVTGLTQKFYPENMASYIRMKNIESDTTGIPADIVAEADRVASSIMSKIAGNSITFVALTDMHELGDSDSTDPTVIERTRRANKNAGQAAKLISDKVSLDFFTNLGDFAYAANNANTTTTYHDWMRSIVNAKTYTAAVVEANESIELPGNHDPLFAVNDSSSTYITNDLITGLIGNYKYVDIAAKKVRVIALHTSEFTEGYNSSARMSGAQMQWFANALDLSSKSDAAKWGIIILSHHPLGWSGLENAVKCLESYVNGTSFSVTHNGVAVSKNFSGKNAAKVIANFHGHVHCLNVGKIGNTDINRIAIPNACYYRNNEYGEYGNLTFGESTTYNKSDNNTGKNTAFCAVTIDLENEVIYADCFGAGYDRTISYAKEEIVTYSITNNTPNSTNSNGATTITKGSPYSASIIANTGYEVTSVTVTMGGTNITSTAYSNGNITIANVTGNIVITVVTTKVAEPHAITYDFANVTSNNMSSQVVANASYTAALTADSGCSINFVRVIMGGVDVTSTVYSNGTISISKVTGDLHIIAGYYTNLVPVSKASDASVYNGTGYKDGAYVSDAGAYGTDATSGCTATGAIPYKSGDVIYIKGGRLSNQGRARLYFQESHSSGSTVALFTSSGFTDTLWTASSGVTMQVEKLADNYYKLTPSSGLNSAIDADDVYRLSVYGNGVDLIVTHNEPIESQLVNLVKTSLSPTGSGIYNGVGYKNGTYATGINDGGSDAACVATGLIPIDSSVNAIYIKGAKWDTSSDHVRFIVMNKVGGTGENVSYHVKADGSGTNQLTNFFTVEELGTNYYKWTLTSSGKTSLTGRYYCVSLAGTGENLVITHNQPIPEDMGNTPKNYSITNSLTNATNSNTATSIVEGSSYSATISPSSGYSVSSITVTMGGTNITSSAVSGNKINIASVTGNIVVTVTTTKLATYTNLVPTATVVNRTTVYNSKGYKDGYRISSAIGESAKSGYVITGVMPYMEDGNGKRKTIYIKGATLDTTDSNCRWSGLPYQINATASNCIQLNGNASAAANQFGTYFTIETLGTNYYKLTPIESKFDAWTGSPIGRMMMSLKGSGANLIVTTDEPIG